MFFTLVNKYWSNPSPWESPRDMFSIASLTCVLSVEGFRAIVVYALAANQIHLIRQRDSTLEWGWGLCQLGGKVMDCGGGDRLCLGLHISSNVNSWPSCFRIL